MTTRLLDEKGVYMTALNYLNDELLRNLADIEDTQDTVTRSCESVHKDIGELLK